MNPWIKFVKSYAQKHGISYKDAMVKAKPHYQKGKGLGQSKAVEFSDIALNNVRSKPKSKAPRRKLIDIIATPMASDRVRKLQAEDGKKKMGKVNVG